MRTIGKQKDKTETSQNIPSNLLNRMLEDSCQEMMQAAEMLARHTTNFENDLRARMHRQEIQLRKLKKGHNELKAKLNKIKVRSDSL